MAPTHELRVHHEVFVVPRADLSLVSPQGWSRRTAPPAPPGAAHPRPASAGMSAARSGASGSTIPASAVKPALRQPGRPWRDRRHQVGDDTQPGEDVIGSHGRGDLPHDQVKYRTAVVRRGRSADATRRSSGTAPRASSWRRPCLVSRSTSTRSAARNAATRGLQRRPASTPGSSIRHREASIRSARPAGAGADLHASSTSSPPAATASSAARSRSASTVGARPDLQVLGLAGDPGRRRPGVGDLRVRGEPCE